ncbi:hypothetical protein SOCE26_104490 [Sorangium cellulosum]|uniref:DUF4365 domain-containing protein n=1 Tax=Sorangium cellulosum TaxID=56 RepID=A0A2L0FBC4_SORCE|nr:DUF4365 domain-containing protein [Sorangium cellulosum]AUX48906.1 hypothetical protein SOCE26_104490 [Sorangium cellulosum]
MLSEPDIKEELSYAYLHAVASRSGFSCENVHKDRDSIDLYIRARGQLHPESTLMSPQLGVQLKATSALDPLPGRGFGFRLTRKNYDDLRLRCMVPRILVVFVLPKDAAAWVAMSEEELVIRRCAYWCSLLGLPDSENERTQEVHVDRKNVLTGEALHHLMVKASREEEIIHGA